MGIDNKAHCDILLCLIGQLSFYITVCRSHNNGNGNIELLIHSHGLQCLLSVWVSTETKGESYQLNSNYITL